MRIKINILEPGDMAGDGWTYVGDDDGKDIFVKGYGVKKWKNAMNFAETQGAHLGSNKELYILQENLIEEGLLRLPFEKMATGQNATNRIWGSQTYKNQPTSHNMQTRKQKDAPNYCEFYTVLFRPNPRPLPFRKQESLTFVF